MSKSISKIKRILLVRPDMVGDVMLITPAITLLREKFPDAHVDLLAQAYTRELLTENKDLNEVIVNPSLFLLKKRKYDLVIHFYNELPYALSTLFAGIPCRIGDRAKILFGWMHNCGVWLKGGNLTEHQVEKNIALLKPLGITMPDPPPGLKAGISKAQKAYLNYFLGENKIEEKNLVVGINPGIGRTSRAWLPERYAKVADFLIENFSARIIITGTKNDQSAASAITKHSKHPLIDLTGKTTLSQLIAIMSRYNLFLSVDTGPLHVAAALGIPTIALFPAKSLKPAEWGPWMTRHIIVRKAMECKRRCFPKKCRYDDCLKAISTDEIISAARELLRGGGNRTLDEARKDWLQKSINILTNNQVIYETLVKNNYCAVKLEKTISLIEFIRLIIKEDINIIHWIDKKTPFNLIAAKLLSMPFVASPTLLISEKENNCPSITDIISLYIAKFRERNNL